MPSAGPKALPHSELSPRSTLLRQVLISERSFEYREQKFRRKGPTASGTGQAPEAAGNLRGSAPLWHQAQVPRCKVMRGGSVLGRSKESLYTWLPLVIAQHGDGADAVNWG